MKRGMLVLVCGLLLAMTGAAAASAADGLVAYWSFDEGAGDTVADSSGNGNNGTIVGATWVDGVRGKALLLDGASSYVRVPDSPSLNLSTAMTIEAWVKSNSHDGARVIVSKWDDANGTWSYIFKDHNGSDTLRVELSRDIHNDLIDLGGANAIPLGEWAHVAVTFEGSTASLYLNGVLDAVGTTAGGTIDASWAELQIGAISGGEVFDGAIDEVRIYNKALTAKQIRARYEAIHDGLAASWSFDEGQGTVAVDDTGNGNDGAIENAAWGAGLAGNALRFDGWSSLVRVPNSPSLNLSTGMTIEACVKSDSTDGARVIVSKWDDNLRSWSYIFKDHNGGDTLRIELSKTWHNDLADLAGVSPIPVSRWTHAAATYDGSTAALYFNGALDSSMPAPGPINASATDLLIGAVNPSGPSEHFAGMIDEVKIYSRPLADGELAAHAAVCGVLTAVVDIKPDTNPNVINLKSKGKVSVAVFGNPRLDVAAIDSSSVRFAGAAASGAPTVQDLNGDGVLDAVYAFASQALQLAPSDTSACLSGKLTSGMRFEGCDSVHILQ